MPTAQAVDSARFLLLDGGNAAELVGTPADGEAILFQAGDSTFRFGLPAASATWGAITGTLSAQADLQSELDGKSPVGHLHDDRYYTEGEVDGFLNAKAPLSSPALTGVPTAPTATTGTNTTQIATTAFVQSELSAAVTGLLELKGDLDCSLNPNYPAGSVGDTYYVSVAGKIGGPLGVAVDVGDAIICKTDNGGGDHATVGADWFILEKNLNGALLSANDLSDVADAATARQNLGLEIGVDVQSHDADLDAISALATTAAGRSVLTIADPNADRMMAWDDSASAVVPIALAALTAEAAPAAGDYLLAYTAEGSLVKIDWADLPSGGGTPGGSSGQLQYNNSGSFGGTAAVVYAASGAHLTITAQAATDVPARIKLAASHTGNALEVNSNAGSGGDLCRITKSGAFEFISSSSTDVAIRLGNFTPSHYPHIQIRGNEATAGRYGLVYDAGADATFLYTYSGRVLGIGSCNIGATTYTHRLTLVDGTGATTVGTGFYIGNGHSSATPSSSFPIQGTAGSGTNIVGANLTIAGGKSTGNATPGKVKVQVSVPGASGSTLQTLVDRAEFANGLNLYLPANAATDVLLRGKAAASHTGNLIELDSASGSGGDLFKVDKDGAAHVATSCVAPTSVNRGFIWGTSGNSGFIYGSSTFFKMNVAAGFSIHVTATGSDYQFDVQSSKNFSVKAAELNYFSGSQKSFAVDGNATAGNTRMEVWSVDAGALKRVSEGAADSGGTGYKLLRVPN